MPGPGNILIKVGADAGQAVRELSTLNSSLGDTMTTGEKMHAGLKKAAIPAALALGAIGAAAIDAGKAAAEDAAAQEHLAGVLERTTGASDAQVAATENWIASVSRATGVADDEMRPALEKIVTATGNVTEAQGLLKQALDISAASGKDLQTVSAAIAKAHEGHTAALAKLVPGLSEASIASKDFDTIMGELADKTSGAMAESAATASGQWKVFTNQTNELKESMGAGLLPIMQAIVPLLTACATWAQNNTTAIKILVGVVATLAGGILIANAALKAYEAINVAVKIATAAWTAAQWLLNAALTANPIGLVIAAIVLLGGALVVAYTKSETFRDIVNAAFAAVKAAASALAGGFTALLGAAQSAFNWIVAHWKLALFAFGPIGAALFILVDHFGDIERAAKSAFSAIVSGIGDVVSAIQSAISWVENLLQKIASIHVPHIDLNPFSAMAPAVAGVSSRGVGATAATAGGVNITVNGAVDPEATARSILRLLSDRDRRMGHATIRRGF
jgi:hypothetical protein